jgi:hypothetical protein
VGPPGTSIGVGLSPEATVREQVRFCVRGVLSPLLSNIMLTDLDRELERRGHAFARYADDCNVSLGSRTAAEHAFETTKRYLERELKLQINLNKSGVAPANRRDFLGYGLIGRETARLKVALHSVQRLRHKVKDLIRRVPEVVLQPHGAGVAGGNPPALPGSIMNRRMRNRTSGGVGGRRG